MMENRSTWYGHVRRRPKKVLVRRDTLIGVEGCKKKRRRHSMDGGCQRYGKAWNNFSK